VGLWLTTIVFSRQRQLVRLDLHDFVVLVFRLQVATEKPRSE